MLVSDLGIKTVTNLNEIKRPIKVYIESICKMKNDFENKIDVLRRISETEKLDIIFGIEIDYIFVRFMTLGRFIQ